jgi:hypothetical protein
MIAKGTIGPLTDIEITTAGGKAGREKKAGGI